MDQIETIPEGTLYRVKSGKEATVFCCDGAVVGKDTLVAAKVLKPLQQRSFKNDAVYQQGRRINDARLARAFRHKTKTGRAVQFEMWVQREALLRVGPVDVLRLPVQ